MIATLVLLTCLSTGGDCRETAVDTIPMLQCVVMWQLPAARYIADNPDRTLTGYKCLPGTGGA